MILTIPKTTTPLFEPDYSSLDLEKWQVLSAIINEDQESYTVEVKWIYPIPYSITAVQGRVQLIRMGLFEQILEMINSSSLTVQTYWEYAVEWNYDSQLLREVVAQLGWTEQQIDDFFIEASKIM